MADEKKNLKLLLEFIDEILERDGYEWFHDELALLFTKKIVSEKDTGIKLSAVTVRELGSIDLYLENGLVPIIDYGKIIDERVRFQLERDAVEMGKVRLSNYSKGISFSNFCKYAHFQSEELINYYYYKVSNDNVDEAKRRIKEYNPVFKDETGVEKRPFTSTSGIPHSVKQFAISNDLALARKHVYTLSNINKLRNLEIHRDSNVRIDDTLKKFIDYENYNQIYEALMHLRDKITEAVK